MKELFKQYDKLKETNETQLCFVDTILQNENYKSQIKKVNNNKAIVVIDNSISGKLGFYLMNTNQKSLYKDNLLDMDVVNLVFAIEELIEGDSQFSNQCKNSIKDKEIRSLCNSLLQIIKEELAEKNHIQQLKDNGVEFHILNDEEIIKHLKNKGLY